MTCAKEGHAGGRGGEGEEREEREEKRRGEVVKVCFSLPVILKLPFAIEGLLKHGCCLIFYIHLIFDIFQPYIGELSEICRK